MNRKVTVVGGAGNVGATVARGVADRNLADVVVIDIADQKASGIALDRSVTVPSPSPRTTCESSLRPTATKCSRSNNGRTCPGESSTSIPVASVGEPVPRT